MRRFISISAALILLLTFSSCSPAAREARKHRDAILAGEYDADEAHLHDPDEYKPDEYEPDEDELLDWFDDAVDEWESDEPVPDLPVSETIVGDPLLLDAAGVIITAKGVGYDSFFGPELALTIENNSDRTLTVQAHEASVNGYMADTILSCEVAAGKKANDTLTFMLDERGGIERLAFAEIRFSLVTEDWDTYYESDTVRIDTEYASQYSERHDESGKVIYDADGLKVISRGIVEDEFLGTGLRVYIHNASARDLVVQTREESVNGYMISAIFSETVLSGMRSIATISFFDSDLEENDIDEVDDIDEMEFRLNIISLDDWSTINESETIRLEF